MVKRVITVLVLILWIYKSWAQEPELKTTLSHDTVSLQELLQVTFELEQAKGKIEPPEFVGFQVVGGPNITTRMQVVQGNMTQSYAVTYVLKPLEEGTFVIERARVTLENDQLLESEPVIISVSNHTSVKNRKSKQSGQNSFDFLFENPFFEERQALPPPAPRDSIQERLKKLPRKKF